MFEDSTFESTGRIHTRSRSWMAATFALNSGILLALILIPLIYPQALPRAAQNILMVAPAPPPEEPKRQPETRVAHASMARMESGYQAPSVIPRHIYYADKREAALPPINVADLGDASPFSKGNNPFQGQQGTEVVRAEPQREVHIAGSVEEGLLLRKTIPAYPPIAIAARVEGTVVLEATISRSGRIENLRAVAGPAMLQQAALNAVQQWRYRPYLLDHQPVEVETTINVVFKLNE